MADKVVDEVAPKREVAPDALSFVEKSIKQRA